MNTLFKVVSDTFYRLWYKIVFKNYEIGKPAILINCPLGWEIMNISILVTVHKFVYITFQLFVYNFSNFFFHLFQLPSFAECFRSIFRIHSETGNIWTHLIGFVAFVIATIVFYVKPFCDFCHHDIQVSNKDFMCNFLLKMKIKFSRYDFTTNPK